MIRPIRQFLHDTTGAVTVDWIVLTAAVVSLGIAATINITDGTTQMGEDLGGFLETDARFAQNR
jgi:Flp pilus assembly pilin Flp|tara:strand:- start:631 stop:822 length:192 start_codon:yes stop_codon:yes gene_type:complete